MPDPTIFERARKANDDVTIRGDIDQSTEQVLLDRVPHLNPAITQARKLLSRDEKEPLYTNRPERMRLYFELPA